MHLKICPICNCTLPPIQPDNCPNCQFDFHTYRIKCVSCAKHFPMENKVCPHCSHPAQALVYSPADIEYSSKIVYYRRIFLFSAMIDNLFLISYILTFHRNPLEIFIIIIFSLSILKALLYYFVSKKPLLVFISAFILTLFPVFFVTESSTYSPDFIIFFIPYTFILFIISLGYNASNKIKNPEIIDKYF